MNEPKTTVSMQGKCAYFRDMISKSQELAKSKKIQLYRLRYVVVTVKPMWWMFVPENTPLHTILWGIDGDLQPPKPSKSLDFFVLHPIIYVLHIIILSEYQLIK